MQAFRLAPSLCTQICLQFQQQQQTEKMAVAIAVTSVQPLGSPSSCFSLILTSQHPHDALMSIATSAYALFTLQSSCCYDRKDYLKVI